MPLVKKARLTRRKVKANRRNGRKANGPKPNGHDCEKRLKVVQADPFDLSSILRSLEGVLDDRLCPRSIHGALTAMGEDPLQFASYHQELIDEWQPTTATLRRLVLRLACLMWRQERAQRAQEGIMLCRMEKEITERSQRVLESVSAPVEPAAGEADKKGGLRQAAPSASKFTQLVDYLELLMHKLQTRDFSPDWEITLKWIYGTKPTLRAGGIIGWSRQLAQYFSRQGQGQAGRPPAEASYDFEDDAQQAPEGWKPPDEPIRTEAQKKEVLRNLRRELAEEHRDVTLEYKLYKSLNIEFPVYLRDSLFAPQEKYWGTAIRQEQSLGQEIERTLRMIVTLKARHGSDRSPARGAGRLAPQHGMRDRTPGRRQRQAMGR